MTIAHDATRYATAGDYFALMKPRVMSLVVFTALAGWFAAPGANDPVLVFAAVLAIAAGATLAGTTAELLSKKLDDNITVPLASALGTLL